MPTPNGFPAVFTADGSFVAHCAGGKFFFLGSGTWGSGTLQFAVSLDGGANYQDLADGSFTANFDKIVELPGCLVKATLSGSTSPSLRLQMAQIPYR